MIYRINRSIIYTPDDGRLTLVEAEPGIYSSGDIDISMAPTANRLLETLITHQGSILQREELLDRVWDAHGLKASNNSLNQYVSLLRRNFADLGLAEPLIITIPTVGFMFSKDILVEKEEEPSESSPDIAHDSHTVAASGVFSFSGKRGLLVILALALVTGANAAFYFYHQAHTSLYQKRYLVGKIAECPVYSFYQVEHTHWKTRMGDVTSEMKRGGLRCMPGSDIYFRIEEASEQSAKLSTFISVCGQTNNNDYATCRSRYAY